MMERYTLVKLIKRKDRESEYVSIKKGSFTKESL